MLAEDRGETEERYTRQMLCLAEECLQLGCKERPEQARLKRIYEKKRAAYGLKKGEMDQLLFERVFHRAPETASDTLRIRYWRTGQHYPVNHATALAFAKALELSGEETRWLIQNWMDKRDLDGKMLREFPALYQERYARLQLLVMEYFLRNSDKRSFSFNQFRHCYFLDALEYQNQPSVNPCFLKGTINSINYDSELKRTMRLSGEIPRRTMLRHLILLDMPELSLEKFQDQLAFFGYLPLDENHTMTGGEYCDRVIMGMIRNYERVRTLCGNEKAGRWFCRCYRQLDGFFAQNGQPAYRFMNFKAIKAD